MVVSDGNAHTQLFRRAPACARARMPAWRVVNLVRALFYNRPRSKRSACFQLFIAERARVQLASFNQIQRSVFSLRGNLSPIVTIPNEIPQGQALHVERNAYALNARL